MAKFCSWCGAPLEPSARYCGECGARVIESVTVDGSRDAVDAMRGFDIVDGQELPADATVRLDRDLIASDKVVVATDTEQKKFSLDTPQAKRKAGFVVLCLAGVLLAAVVAFGAFHFGANQGETADLLEVTGIESAEPEGETKQASQKKEKPAAPTDADIYKTLKGLYKELESKGGFSDRLGVLVDDFNTYFLDPDMSDREKAKETADAMLTDLEANLKTLKELKLPKNSVYAEDLATIIELYECQIGNVKSFTDAWALDVTFDSPTAHQDEILAVLSRDYENGSSSYLNRYDEIIASYELQQKH